MPPTNWPEVSYAPMPGLPKITVPAMTCCLGLEDSIEAYVGHMVLVFRGLWRVLRGDGVGWLNLGDSYAGNNLTGRNDNGRPEKDKNWAEYDIKETKRDIVYNFKTKNLCGIPWRVAFALQADGWYLRSDIIWAKKNCMPESCQDRPTKSHEYLFLLAKSERYWYDQEAIREPANYDGRKDTMMKGSIKLKSVPGQTPNSSALNGAERWPNKTLDGNPGRNKRTVWSCIDEIAEHNELFAFILARLASDHTELLDNILDEYGSTPTEKTDIWELATKPYKDAHFAVMPEALVEPCLLAGCPAQVCAECGEPWVRVVEKETEFHGGSGRAGRTATQVNANGKWAGRQYGENLKLGPVNKVKTLHFSPTCQCSAPTRPGVALDPFFGSGTVGVVSKKLKRDWLGIELNPKYVELARKRLNETQPALFALT